MKLAIPIYNVNVSNVFDFAHKLLLVDIENSKEINRSEVVLDSQLLPQRVALLKTIGTDVLVCGAISRPLADMVMASGIEIFPYITGHIDNVLQAYMTGQLSNPEFSMPGYWPGAQKGFGYRRRACRWKGSRSK